MEKIYLMNYYEQEDTTKLRNAIKTNMSTDITLSKAQINEFNLHDFYKMQFY